MKKQILSIQQLNVLHQKTRKPILKNISFQLKTGKVLALIGPSGSGKTTICSACLNILSEGLMLSSGEINLNGQKINSFDQLRGHQIASIMQNPRTAFNPIIKIKAHIEETLVALRLSKKITPQEIDEVLKEVELDQPKKILELFPFEMSDGMLQRVMIAIAILSKSPFIFADEPTNNLDIFAQNAISKILEYIVKSRNKGLLLITHDIDIVARLADEVLIIEEGAIVERGRPIDVFRHPNHTVTQELVQSHLSLYQYGTQK